MPHLLAYARDTGLIQGVWTAAHVDHLRPNIEPEHPTLDYLLLTEAIAEARVLQERYWVQGAQLRERLGLTLQAVPNPFPADGLTECLVRVEPFVPCTLLVDGRDDHTTIALATEEEPLILTADLPQRIQIALAPLQGYWAAPLTVEAQ